MAWVRLRKTWNHDRSRDSSCFDGISNVISAEWFDMSNSWEFSTAAQTSNWLPSDDGEKRRRSGVAAQSIDEKRRPFFKIDKLRRNVNLLQIHTPLHSYTRTDEAGNIYLKKNQSPLTFAFESLPKESIEKGSAMIAEGWWHVIVNAEAVRDVDFEALA